MNNALYELRKIGSLVVGLIFFVGFFLILALLFVGFTKVIEFLLPVALILSGTLFLVFLVVVLPLSLLQRFRLPVCRVTLLFSYIFEVSVWMLCFLLIIKTMGSWGLLFLLLFQAVVPLAIIGLIAKGFWAYAGLLLVALFVPYGMRLFAFWLAALRERAEKDKDVIEAEFREVD